MANLKPFSVNIIKTNAAICVATKRSSAVKSNFAIYHLVNFVALLWLCAFGPT